MHSLVVQNLTKTFRDRKGPVKAVDNISFKVKSGEFFGLLGSNGAGKTTTINMLTGLLTPDSGKISILGKDPEKEWEYVKNRINVSTAYYSLSDVLTVKQNLRVYAKVFNVKNVEEKINKLLKEFELSHLENRQVSKLSSGETTRVALCKGLINSPKVLFLDECTVGLDPDVAEVTRNVLKNYQKENNTTVLFTSHYMFEVEELCKRIAFMRNGKIMQIDSASKLKKMITNQTIEITVKENSEKLKKFLNQEGMEVIFTKGNTIVFNVTSERDKVYKVLNKIFSKGYMLNDLHIKKPTLEDIFIRFAREK